VRCIYYKISLINFVLEAQHAERQLIQDLSLTPLPPVQSSSQDTDWMDCDESNSTQPLDFTVPISHAGGELEALSELRAEIANLSGRYVHVLLYMDAYLTILFVLVQRTLEGDVIGPIAKTNTSKSRSLLWFRHIWNGNPPPDLNVDLGLLQWNMRRPYDMLKVLPPHLHCR
jgi:hypothetical protein